MQISIIWVQIKYPPHGVVLGCGYHALQATSHRHRHLRQLRLKYESRPSTTCGAKLRAQIVASSKMPTDVAVPPTIQTRILRHTNTPVIGTKPTRYNRRPNRAVSNRARLPNRLRQLAILTARSHVHSTVSKNFNINRAQRYETTDVVSLPP